MTITAIYPTTHFIKAYKGLPENIKLSAKHKEAMFKANPFNPMLKTHKLKGRLSDCWSYYIDHQYRIIFRFINSKSVIYYDIGTHAIYK